MTTELQYEHLVPGALYWDCGHLYWIWAAAGTSGAWAAHLDPDRGMTWEKISVIVVKHPGKGSFRRLL